jgi:amidase
MIKRFVHWNATASVAILTLLLAMSNKAEALNLPWTQEATIADIHAAIRSKNLTCRQLVQTYLDRIEAYDKKGPALNAIIVVNPNALATAEELDAHFAQSGLVGSLHCIPMIVKDNYDFAGLPTTAGPLSLKGSMPARDAFQVRRCVRRARSCWPSRTWRSSPGARSKR